MFRSSVLKLSTRRLCTSRPRIRISSKPLAGALSLSTSNSRAGDTDVHLQAQPGPLRHCPKCQAVLPTPLPACTRCFYIQRTNNKIPYHELFQLPFEPNPFVLDTSQLKRRYIEAQRLCHPDRWASHGEVCGASRDRKS